MDLTVGGVPRPQTVALDRWRARRPADFGPLWQAACWEAAAIAWWQAGQLRSCLDCIATAEAIALEELDHLEGIDLP